MSSETSQTPATSVPADARGGLWSRSFLGLLVTQALGAVNDNMFRWLVVPISKDLIGEENVAVALSAGLACFVLPYILLAAPAGYLADRFSKRSVIVGCKVAEVVIMALGVAAILVGNLYLMFAIVALMGMQSALFGPSKLGSIPEIVRSDRISAANGLIGMTTVVAVVVGSVSGNLLYGCTTLTGPDGALHVAPTWWGAALALLGVAVAGLSASLLIARLRSADPQRAFPFNAAGQTVRDLGLLWSHRPLLRAALGCAAFWALGALAQMNIDVSVRELGAGQADVGIWLAVLSLGVGVGSVLAGIWSAGRVELGIVSLGAAGIAVSAMLLFAVPQPEGNMLSAAYFWSCVWLFMLGASAGLYNIPIQAFLQHRSPEKSIGSILAASNFLAFSAMLGAAGLFWLSNTVLGLSARQIFLLLGIGTVPVFLYVVWLLPGPTLRFLVWLLSHTIYRVRVRGGKNVPRQGGALLVANHVSWLDGVLLILYSPRPLRMVVFADYLDKWWFRWFAKDLGAIPIKPGKRSVVRSIETAREALREGDLVGIFPEGRLTRTGHVEEFRPGFLAMLKDADVPVVPIHLGGLWGSIFSYERGKLLWKWPRRWPYRISIVIGPPIDKPADAEQVRRAVASLGDQP